MNFINTLRWVLVGTFAWGACILVQAQVPVPPEDLEPKTLPADPPRIILPEGARMQTTLYEAEQSARDQLPFELLEVLPDDVPLRTIVPDQFSAVQGALARRGVNLRNDGRVNVEIIGPRGAAAVDQNLIVDFDGELNGVWRHRRDVWVPVHQLTALAQQLPEGYFMERVGPMTYDDHGEGPDVINSVSYIDGGADGSGITIAVIDGGYVDLLTSQLLGHAPSGNQVTALTCGAFSCSEVSEVDPGFLGNSSHGTGCVEATFSNAPGATYRLYRITSLTQMGQAVDDAIDNGVDIITHSLSRYNQGWADNSGDACDIANTAADAGLLFFTSAGNRAQQHWQGVMNPGSGSWHRFSGNDQTIAITLGNNGGGSFWLQWNTAGGTFDYDLYLWDANIENVLASSTNAGNTYESFTYHNTTGSTQTVHLAVYHASGGNTEFELFMHASCTATPCGGIGDFQHIVSAGSITSPSNSTHPNVISNAAVDWSDHDLPNGTVGIIQDYSSRGPSNSGAIRPDIAGPTNTSTNCCGGSFGGTSAATPNNAGAAAAFWSAHPQFNAPAIRWLMFEQARLWKDWGASGKDNNYGHGGAILIDYVPNTTWLARSFGNAANFPTGPLFIAQVAYNVTPDGGRVLIFPGGNYPESFTSSGNKSVLFKSVEHTATLGSP